MRTMNPPLKIVVAPRFSRWLLAPLHTPRALAVSSIVLPQPQMKTKKGKKNSAGTAIASAGASDTARWEQLLSGGGGGSGAAASTTAVKARPADGKPAGTMTPRSDKLPVKAKALGNSYASVTNNWQHLLTGGTAATARAGAAATSNGQLSDKAKKKKAKKVSKGNKRPRSEIGQMGGVNNATATTPDFFSAKRASNGVQPQTATTGPGGKGGGAKRKRAGAAAADANANGFPPAANSKQQKHSGAAMKKRPRSNVLNLAFQAQQEEASAAAAAAVANGAGGNVAKHGGRDKGRGSRAGGRGGSEQSLTAAEMAQYVALDCEMVGVGPGGCRSALARCCLVDWEGTTM